MAVRSQEDQKIRRFLGWWNAHPNKPSDLLTFLFSRISRSGLSALEDVEHLREAARVALLGLRERLEPLGDVVEALFAGRLRHAGVHRLVLVRLAGDRGLQVLLGVADGEVRRRIAHLLEVVEVAVRVAGL